MKKYAFFVGCTIPFRIPFVETSVRKIFPEFDIELVDLPFACCPDPGGVQAFDTESWHTLAARNICLAEEQNLDIIAACSGCFETLKVTNVKLKENAELRNKINENLKEVDREFKGTIKVKHFAQVLFDDIGPEMIASKVKTPLSGLKIATHSGCHFLKPPEILQTDNPENPQKLDKLVDALGAEAIPYIGKLACCGAGTRSTDQKIAVSMAHEKIVGAQQAKADAIVTICPTCFIQFDVGQRLMARQFEEKTNLPIFYYAELLGLAMGIDLNEGFKMHTIKVNSVLEPFSEQYEQLLKH